MKKKFRLRFAPSPTGEFHIGSAYISMINYFLYSSNLSKQSIFLLRIDDTDKNRSDIKYISNIIESLKYLHIEYNASFSQSERVQKYKNVIQQSWSHNFFYTCACYKKICCCKQNNIIDFNNLIRVNMTRVRKIIESKIFIPDCITKNIWLDVSNVEDFVIFRNDMPTYHLASVIDDIEFEITHIVRGQEWINSTHKYLILSKILSVILKRKINFKFIHISSIFDVNTNKKLSKRKDDVSLLFFIKRKYHYLSILFYLLQLGIKIDLPEDFIINFINVKTFLKHMKHNFSIEKIKLRTPFFDIKKIKSINTKIINTLDKREFKTMIFDCLSPNNQFTMEQSFSIYNHQYFTISNIDQGIQYLNELGNNFNKQHAKIVAKKYQKEIHILLSFLKTTNNLLEVLNIKQNKIRVFKLIREMFTNTTQGLPIFLILCFHINIQNNTTVFYNILKLYIDKT